MSCSFLPFGGLWILTPRVYGILLSPPLIWCKGQQGSAVLCPVDSFSSPFCFKHVAKANGHIPVWGVWLILMVSFWFKWWNLKNFWSHSLDNAYHTSAFPTEDTLQWLHPREAQEPQLIVLPACNLGSRLVFTLPYPVTDPFQSSHQTSCHDQCHQNKMLLKLVQFMQSVDWLFSHEISSSCPYMHAVTLLQLQLSGSIGISWTFLSIQVSRGWHSSSSFSQCRWFPAGGSAGSLLGYICWFSSSGHSGFAHSGVASDGQCASPVHRTGVEAVGWSRSWVKGDSPRRRSMGCAHQDQVTPSATGAGALEEEEVDTIWSAVCQEESLQLRWRSSPPGPQWGSQSQGYHTAIHTMQIVDKGGQETSWQEEIRDKGCEEQAASARTPGRWFAGSETGCRMDEPGLHPWPWWPLSQRLALSAAPSNGPGRHTSLCTKRLKMLWSRRRRGGCVKGNSRMEEVGQVAGQGNAINQHWWGRDTARSRFVYWFYEWWEWIGGFSAQPAEKPIPQDEHLEL